MMPTVRPYMKTAGQAPVQEVSKFVLQDAEYKPS